MTRSLERLTKFGRLSCFRREILVLQPLRMPVALAQSARNSSRKHQERNDAAPHHRTRDDEIRINISMQFEQEDID